MTTDCIDALADGLLALEEPWRGRFLALLTERARGLVLARGRREGLLSTRAQVAAWLDDLDIYLEFSQLLDVWRGVRT